MKKLICLVCLLFLCFYSFAQEWSRIGRFYWPPREIVTDISDSSVIILATNYVDTFPCPGLVKIKNNQFFDFGGGVSWDCTSPLYILPNSGLYGLGFADNKLWICGRYSYVNCQPSLSFAFFNQGNWEIINDGFTTNNGGTFGVKEINNETYLFGAFDSVFGLECNGIVKYNGSTWSNVYNLPKFSPVNGSNYINDIAWYKNRLYIGGNFYSGFDSTDIDDIAVYNGTEWTKIGTKWNGSNGGVLCMTVYKNELYVGGSFYKDLDPNAPGNGIAKWDGTKWSSLGGANEGYGTNCTVFSMEEHNGYLYVAGCFTTAGGLPSTGMARWDGNNWCSMGNHFNPEVNNLISDFTWLGDTLFAVGGFNSVDGDTSIKYVAKRIGDGVEECTTLTIKNFDLDEKKLHLFPNPTDGILNINLNSTNLNSTNFLKIINSQGSIVFEKIITKSEINSGLSLETKYLTKGIYFILINNSYPTKFVITE
jgi:hypothetical protein